MNKNVKGIIILAIFALGILALEIPFPSAKVFSYPSGQTTHENTARCECKCNK